MLNQQLLFYPPHSQVLALEEAGWVVKWRQISAHALDVNCVQWAGQHALVTAGCNACFSLRMNLSLNVALQVTTSASTYGNCMSRERGGLGANVQCSAVALVGGA